MKMRESFIFHAEYIDDLPDEYKGVFGMYALNYGIMKLNRTFQGLKRHSGSKSSEESIQT